MDNNKLKYAEVSGYKLAYQTAGEGEPLLLVHGITTYSFIWRRIIPKLKTNYKITAVDLLGCGASDKPLDIEYSIINHARLLKEFVEQTDLGKVHFIGHDIGGGIGQRFAVEYPEFLTKLTLINSVGYDYWPVQPIVIMRTPIIRQFAMAALDLGSFRMIVKRGLYHKENLTLELMDLFWKPMKTKEGRKAFLHFAASLNNKHLLEIENELKNLQIPVLILRGSHDPYLSWDIAARLHNDIPGSRLEIIRNSGHFMQEDEPEKIVQALTKFIQES